MNALRLSRAVMIAATVLAVAAALAGTFGAAIAGCSTGTDYVWNCAGPDGGNIGTDVSQNFVCPCSCCIDGPVQGGPFPTGDCPFADGGTGADGGPLPGCAGQCVPNPPTYWSGPVLLWYGASIDAPSCPASAAGVGYQGYAEPTTNLVCDVCSCSTPTGTCGLPATITLSAASCNEDGGTTSPFDPPPAWDGGCIAYDAIDAGVVGSVTVAPLALNERGCTPVLTPRGSTEDPGWHTFAFDCTSSAGGTCPSTGETCTPTAPMGFRQCVTIEGDMDCPSASFNPYTEKHVFYTSATDTQACSACDCASAPGSCSATLSLYANSTCSGAVLGAVTVTSDTPGCVTAAGATVQSQSSGPATYTPGTCQPSGGVASGTVTPGEPSTFCCLPP